MTQQNRMGSSKKLPATKNCESICLILNSRRSNKVKIIINFQQKSCLKSNSFNIYCFSCQRELRLVHKQLRSRQKMSNFNYFRVSTIDSGLFIFSFLLLFFNLKN